MKALAASRSTELGYCPGNYDSLDLRARRLGRSIEGQRVGRNRGVLAILRVVTMQVRLYPVT